MSLLRELAWFYLVLVGGGTALGLFWYGYDRAFESIAERFSPGDAVWIMVLLAPILLALLPF
jgi:hypothetical protein